MTTQPASTTLLQPAPHARPLTDVSSRCLAPFLALAFGLTWGVTGLWLTMPDQLTAIFGELGLANPLFFLAVHAPAIAAFVVVLISAGQRGLLRYLGRLRHAHCPPAWLALLLLGIPANFYLGVWLRDGHVDLTLPFDSLSAALPAMGLMMTLGPVEEFGWRGVALPILQRRLAPLWAGLILGVIWALWHLPAFLLSGTPQSEWSVWAFSIGSVAVCVIMTPFFNACRGSLLLAALFHFQLINPLFPDAQPHDTLFFVLTAVVVVWINRRAMLRRPLPCEATTDNASAVTEVIPRPIAS